MSGAPPQAVITPEPGVKFPYYGPYPATIAEWHDGDTCRMVIDLGFGLAMHLSCRCYGINAPELSSGKPGADATAAARALAPEGSQVTVLSHNWDKYGGRFLGEIRLAGGRSFAEEMISGGHARPYFGVGPKPV